ncbi:hypothetical protein C8F01DRAFT_1084317 [Mycena amicta]|nr:hypothetical protein C8F01DRAFT_1084317 [Mycena amicta]
MASWPVRDVMKDDRSREDEDGGGRRKQARRRWGGNTRVDPTPRMEPDRRLNTTGKIHIVSQKDVGKYMGGVGHDIGTTYKEHIKYALIIKPLQIIASVEAKAEEHTCSRVAITKADGKHKADDNDCGQQG